MNRLLIALTFAATLGAQQPRAEQAEQAMSEERYADAIGIYSQLLKAEPDNTGYRTNLGIALYSTNQYPKAAEQFEIVRKARPDFAPAALMLGLTYSKMGEPAKAVPPLEQALEADPANYGARFEFARCLRLAGRYEEAASNYFKLADRNPNFAPAWQGLVLCYVALAKREPAGKPPDPPPACPADPPACEYEAGRYWQTVEAVKGQDTPAASYWRKQAYTALADRAMASFSAQPPAGETHELLAEIYAAQDRTAEAISEWRQALELSPDSAEVNYQLGRALLKSGKAAEGRVHLEIAAKLGSQAARRALPGKR